MLIGGLLGILDSLTGGEVIMILVAALLVLGPERLPETARTMGQWIAKLKAMTGNLQSEVREVLDDPSMKPIRDLGEFAAAPRKKLVEFATAAEAEANVAKQVAEDAAELVEDTPPDEAVPGEPGAGREASIWADLDDDTPRDDAPVDDVTPLVDAPVDETPLDDVPLADHGASEST